MRREGEDRSLPSDVHDSSSWKKSRVIPWINTGNKIVNSKQLQSAQRKPACQQEPSVHDVFIKSACLLFSMRKLRAHSSVPKGSASHKKGFLRHVFKAQGQLAFPWCSCSSPIPGGRRARFDCTIKRLRSGVCVTEKRKTSASHLYGKFLGDWDGFPQTAPTASSAAFGL